MIYPRNLRRLSACEVERTFSSFTGRDSKKPCGVYGFKSESMCQIAVRTYDNSNNGFLMTTACFDTLVAVGEF